MLKDDYSRFLASKKIEVQYSGFDVDESDLNGNLKDFQKYGLTVALKKGKFSFFFDCGLGKTISQLEWANQVFIKTGKKVIILAPLAVVEQTKEEALKFGIPLESFDIVNYEQLINTDVSIYSGVVLDESSILKGRDGKTSRLLIDTFKHFKYKLCCTATPSQNDNMELGQNSEFF